MLSITQSAHAKLITPNILPCQISHTGQVNASKQFWNPQVEKIKGDIEGDGGMHVTLSGLRIFQLTRLCREGGAGSLLSGQEAVGEDY